MKGYSGLPDPFEKDRPLRPKPQLHVNPKLVEALEGITTPEELQYALNTLKARILKLARKSQPQIQVREPVVDPAQRDFIEDIKRCELIDTAGYTIQYAPPETQPRQNISSESTSFREALKLLDAWNPSLKREIGTLLGELLDLLNKKLEEVV